MRSRAVLLGLVGLLAAGCGFHSPDTPGGDAAVDMTVCKSFATLLDTCGFAFGSDLMLSGMAQYDTTAHALTVGGVAMPFVYQTLVIGGVEVDVISAHTVTLAASAKLRGIGTRPLAIVASESITAGLGVEIDVSAGGAGTLATCPNGAAAGMPGTGGAGGGGGGGFGADGGDGGPGDGDGAGPDTPGGGQGHELGAVPAGLRGGCPGAAGGTGLSAGGTAGSGGGALYLVAGNRIELASGVAIHAGGGGGGGGAHIPVVGGDAGGGGGGSGGMIVLEALHITGTGTTIAANGGGGGGGSSGIARGDDGTPGTLTASAAGGGAGGMNAASGGAGGSGNVPAGQKPPGGVPAAGGGGGGGGVGIIRILSNDTDLGVISPAQR